MFYGGKYLERAWGSREFGKFILVLALASNLSMVLLYLTTAAIRGKPEIAYVLFLGLSGLPLIICS